MSENHSYEELVKENEFLFKASVLKDKQLDDVILEIQKLELEVKELYKAGTELLGYANSARMLLKSAGFGDVAQKGITKSSERFIRCQPKNYIQYNEEILEEQFGED
jgi:hypothetical protein